jgi:hypothetical protein
MADPDRYASFLWTVKYGVGRRVKKFTGPDGLL